MNDRNYLISFPKSGNTAIRLFLERHTRKPTSRCIVHDRVSDEGVALKIVEDWTKGRDTSLLYPGRSDFIVWKAHGFPAMFQPGDKVIFLLRDYKDAIISFIKYRKNITNLLEPGLSDDDYLKLETCMISEIVNYVNLLKAYHKCENNKILIRYEDLIRNGHKELISIIRFLNLKIDYRKIKRCNPFNAKGKQEIDEWFKEVNGKGEKFIHSGTKYIGRYKDYLKDSTVKKVQDAMAAEMGDLHGLYTKGYDV